MHIAFILKFTEPAAKLAKLTKGVIDLAAILRASMRLLFSISLIAALQACAVVAVADAAVTVVATGVKLTVKTVGAVADVVIPDSDD